MLILLLTQGFLQNYSGSPKPLKLNWKVSTRLSNDPKNQLHALKNLAKTLKDNGVPTDNTSLKNLTTSALQTSMQDNSINTDAKDISEDAMKEILKAAINKVTEAVPDTNQKIVEKDIQEKFDDSKHGYHRSYFGHNHRSR